MCSACNAVQWACLTVRPVLLEHTAQDLNRVLVGPAACVKEEDTALALGKHPAQSVAHVLSGLTQALDRASYARSTRHISLHRYVMSFAYDIIK